MRKGRWRLGTGAAQAEVEASAVRHHAAAAMRAGGPAPAFLPCIPRTQTAQGCPTPCLSRSVPTASGPPRLPKCTAVCMSAPVNVTHRAGVGAPMTMGGGTAPEFRLKRRGEHNGEEKRRDRKTGKGRERETHIARRQGGHTAGGGPMRPQPAPHLTRHKQAHGTETETAGQKGWPGTKIHYSGGGAPEGREVGGGVHRAANRRPPCGSRPGK